MKKLLQSKPLFNLINYLYKTKAYSGFRTWFIGLAVLFLSAHAYAQNPTQGPLQYDPNLRGYGYGINQSPQGGGYSPPPRVQIIHRQLPDQWGAGVVNELNGHGYSSTHMSSEEAAIQNAMAQCIQSNEDTQCKYFFSYKNQCVVVYKGSLKDGSFDRFFSGFGVRIHNAERDAINECKKHKGINAKSCHLITSECSYACHPDEYNCYTNGKKM